VLEATAGFRLCYTSDALGPPRLITSIIREASHERSSKEIRIRLLLSIGLVVVLASVYVRALAVASVFGTFSGMVRPWQDVGTDLLLLGLSVISLACVAPAVRIGSRPHRVIGLVLALLPLLVLGHFITWLILEYERWRG